MRDPAEFHRILFLALILVFPCLGPALAQKNQEPNPPKYDAHTETKMKGTVEEVKLPPKGSEKEAAHLAGEDRDGHGRRLSLPQVLSRRHGREF